MEQEYCIWGCGIRGKNICRFLKKKGVRAFIDVNPALQGKSHEGIPIISFEEYLQKYRNAAVIIATYYYQDEIIPVLERHDITFFPTALLPPEMTETPVLDLFGIVDQRTKESETVYLYGANLFSFLLLEHYQNAGRRVKIFPGRQDPPKLWQLVKTRYPDCVGDCPPSGNGRVWLTSNCYIGENVPGAKDLFDFMKDAKSHHNPDISRFQNIHRGRRCFIVATGASLRFEDLNTLAAHDEVCISMNGIIRAFPSTKWRPDYYMIEDRAVFQKWKDELAGQCRMERMLIADICLDKPYNGIFIPYHLSFLRVDEKNPPRFSMDFAQGAYESGTITYNCLQFAVYLGCEEIYLYGVDYDFSRPQNHFSKDDIQLGAPKTQTIEPLQIELARSKLGYQKARSTAEEQGIRIYNASRYTKLDVFEKVDFDSLF